MSLINLIKNSIFLYVCDIYDLFLFISSKAFVPSLRVLKISQEREETIRIVNIIREIWVRSN